MYASGALGLLSEQWAPSWVFIYGGLAMGATQLGAPAGNLSEKGKPEEGRTPSFCGKDRAWPLGWEGVA